MSDYGSDVEDDSEFTLANPAVVDKYKVAAEIANKALAACIAACKPGAKVADICGLGDKTIEEEAAKFYNKKDKDGNKIDKGIAFPTCVSVNNQVCHNSPEDDDTTVLEEGQAVKLDLGAHVDGYIAVVANTVVLMGDMNAPVTGVQADAMQAAITAGEAAIRKLRPGVSNQEVGKAIERVAEDFGVHVVEGVLTHSMKRFVIDGNKVVLNKTSPELKADDETIELNEVYALDIVMSSGEGKPKIQDEKETNVYKRAIEKNYKLKMQASRAVFSEISKKFPTMPFTMRAMGDIRGARLGLVECMKHELLHEYPVLYEKPGDAVAHFKATVLVMQNGNDRITTWTSQPIQSDLELTDEDLKALIATPLKSKKKKAKK
jgi:methionyl aminopeptidase